MTIKGCPTCEGQGWSPVAEDGQLLSFWEHLGVLRRFEAPVGELLATDPGRAAAYIRAVGLDTLSLEYSRCWCNGPVATLAARANRPLYWRNDLSGHYVRLGEAFLKDEPMTDQDVKDLKGYIGQWVTQLISQPGAPPPQRQIPSESWLPQLAAAQTREDLVDVVHELFEWGLHPF